MIVAFSTRANARVRELADREGVEIKQYSIIYQVIDDIKAAISGMLSPEIKVEVTGAMEIREIYKISGVGTAAGCMVTSGYIKRNSNIKIIRKGDVIHDGALKSLKRFKEDVGEVKEGYECGVLINNFNDITEGDIIEAYENKEIERTFDDVANKEKAAEKLKSDE